MKSKFEIHPIQTGILKILVFNPKSRFSDLNTEKIESDQFSFHLKSLLDAQLVEKDSQGLYRLTIQGKEFANRLDTQKLIIEKQAKIGVLIVNVRKNKGVTEYLIQQRLKHPYYGFYGFVTGKISIGETPQETAIRELFEETGLKSGKISLASIKHKMDYSQLGELLEDKFFFIFKTEKQTGKLIENFEGGRNIWMPLNEITKLDNLFDGVIESIDLANSHKLTYLESKYTVSGF